MSTFTQLKSQIANDLRRTDIDSEIEDAIHEAIRAYEGDRFWFNERYRVSVTLSTSSATIALTSIDPYFREIDRVRLLLTSTEDRDLYPRDYAWVMSRQDIQLDAQPLYWAIYADTIQFDSYADQNYTLTMDGIEQFGGVTSSFSASSSDAWFGFGKDLIRSRAKLELYTHVIKGSDRDMLTMAAAESRAYTHLKSKTNQRGSGRVRPTQW